MKTTTRKKPAKPAEKPAKPATKPDRPVIRLTGEQRLSDEELHDALCQLHEGHPVLLAIRQILTEHVENAMSQVSRPELAESPGALAHTAGGLEWLRFLAQDFEDVRAGLRATRRSAAQPEEGV
jgi:hypothetical protein